MQTRASNRRTLNLILRIHYANHPPFELSNLQPKDINLKELQKEITNHFGVEDYMLICVSDSGQEHLLSTQSALKTAIRNTRREYFDIYVDTQASQAVRAVSSTNGVATHFENMTPSQIEVWKRTELEKANGCDMIQEYRGGIAINAQVNEIWAIMGGLKGKAEGVWGGAAWKSEWGCREC